MRLTLLLIILLLFKAGSINRSTVAPSAPPCQSTPFENCQETDWQSSEASNQSAVHSAGMLLECSVAARQNRSSAGQDHFWELQDSRVDVSLRGVSAVSDTCCWASGAKGTVIRTTDGGKTWQSIGLPGTETADFRDIHAWDESTAVIMSAGDVDRLYRTTDGGKSWTIVYEHSDPAAFFDGISFDQTGKHGWLMGDPINGKVHLVTTDDAGVTWKPVPESRLPSVVDGIAAFAASGTHLLNPNSDTVIIGLGGIDRLATEHAQASVLMTMNSGNQWRNIPVPMQAGPSSGVFSITLVGNTTSRLVVVGGDYQKPEQDTDNVAISDDFGRSWRRPSTSNPKGFRSAVVSVPGDDDRPLLIATGPSGTDRSTDEGESWSSVSQTGFHTLSFVSPGTLWAAGSDGRVARWQLER